MLSHHWLQYCKLLRNEDPNSNTHATPITLTAPDQTTTNAPVLDSACSSSTCDQLSKPDKSGETRKRKRMTLLIQDKLDILKKIDEKVKIIDIANAYG